MRKYILYIIGVMFALSAEAQTQMDKELLFVYNLRTQYRRLKVNFTEQKDTLTMHWTFTNDAGTKRGTFTMTPKARQHATRICYVMPTNGENIAVPDDELFAVISRDALDSLNTNGSCHYNNTTLTLVDRTETQLHVKDYDEGYEMWIDNNPTFPLIRKMLNNPVEIDWEVFNSE